MSNVFIIASTSVVCKIFALQLKPSVVIFWMLVPLLFSLFVSKKTATEIHAHIAITATMSGFLLFVVCCCVKFFNLSLMIANFFFVLVLITAVMQLTRRYFFMKYCNNS
jgi:hypothetical protein